jgi:hypothetical protein
MRIVVRVLGFPVMTLDVDGVFVTEEEPEEESDEKSRIEGGSAHDFERDVNPVAPEDRYQWEWDDKRRFGFRA